MLIGNLILLGLLLVGFLWYFDQNCLKKLNASIKLDQPRSFINEDFDLILHLTNHKAMILPVIKIRLHLPAMIVQADAPQNPNKTITFMTSLLFYQKLRRRIPLRGLQRGLWEIKAELEFSDFLGLSRQTLTFEEPLRILIHPKIEEEESLVDTQSGTQGDRLVQRWLHPDPIFYTGNRPYLFNDPLKDIDWKASARFQALRTRLHDTTASFQVSLCILAENNENLYADDPQYIEAAVSFAAFVLNDSWQKQCPCGLLTNAVVKADFGPTFRPDSGINHIIRCFDVLACLAGYKHLSTTRTLNQLLQFTESGNDCILICNKLNDAIVSACTSLLRKGIYPTLVLYTVPNDLVLPHGIAVRYLKRRKAHE